MSLRPSYERADTDAENVGRTSGTERRGSKIDQLFPKEFHGTEPIKPAFDEKRAEEGSGNESGGDLPRYEGDEYNRRFSMVATTAEDLVTQVINVEDDPSLNPWTFRTFFLGTLLYTALGRDEFERFSANF
jgi:hypothetical protein